MKASILHGKNQDLQIESFTLPDLQPGEVRVRIKAAALNHRDVWIQQGQYAGLKYPIILGSDGAGVVESLGEKVDSSWLGKEVIINPSHNWGKGEACQGRDFKILGLPDNGCFAEYVQLGAEYLYPKPPHLTLTESAALPLAGLTAFRALFSRAGLQKGEKLLISGAGGGVAQFGLLLGVAAGAEVWVTSGSAEKIEACKALGAMGGISYKSENWSRELSQLAGGFDVILDGAGGDGFNELLKAANPGGRIVNFGGTRGKITDLTPQILFWKQLSILGSTMGSPGDFQAYLKFVESHQIRPTLDRIYPFAEINLAFRRMAAGEQMGKILVEL
ncbi:MAG: zinc-binding dehydrogenase [Bacteroidia bacterium]|nr:zinc-binding dehydrogenase [Bacteroidia bacterium]